MSQANLLLNLLQDGEPHRTDEIVKKVYGEGLNLARVAARINDLKKKGNVIHGYKDRVNPKLYWYQLLQVAGKVSGWSHNPGKVGSIPTPATKLCCPSKKIFGVCARDCVTNKEQVLL